MVFLPAVAAPAQQLSDVDFSDAHIGVAGPRSFYVRGLEADGERFSVVVTPSDSGAWEVDRIVDDAENLVPRRTILDLATVRRVDDRTLEIDGVVVGDRVYSGRLQIGPDLTVRPLDGVVAGDAEAVNEQRAEGLAAAGLGFGPEIDRLERENDRLRDENDRLSTIVSELRAENEYLRGEVARLLTRVDELEAASPATGDAARGPATDGGSAELAEEAKRITSRIEELSAQLAEVENRLAERIDSAAGDGAPDAGRGPEDLRRRVAELELRNAELQAEKLALQDRILDRVADGGFVEMMAPRLRTTLLDDLSSARVQLGDWRLSGRSAVQTDPDQYFAKLMLPAPQRTRPTLYSFSARALDEGWVGLGLHIFVEETGKTGYGLGRSLLVWFTRDPDVYKNRLTYLQVYRSDDDVNMARVADALIEEPISGELDIEVLFEPENNYITIAVNGRDKLRYRTWFGIDEGTGVALRTLGRAEFRNLSVRTTE
jgi:hypothetical protein